MAESKRIEKIYAEFIQPWLMKIIKSDFVEF